VEWIHDVNMSIMHTYEPITIFTFSFPVTSNSDFWTSKLLHQLLMLKKTFTFHRNRMATVWEEKIQELFKSLITSRA